MSNTHEEDVCTFKLPERFNADTPREIITELQELPDCDSDCIALNMSGTVSMDSSGIGMLVFLYKELTARSKSLILKNPQRGVYDLLAETGIDRLFDVEMSSGIRKADAGLTGLKVQVQMEEEIVGNVRVISLSGVMNYPTGSTTFKKNITPTLQAGGKILLDFSELAFFDSLSVGSVLRVSRLLADIGGGIRICRANHVVRDMLESMGVDAIIPFFDTREAALEDWE
ncbi:MAG: STAS domain-containing protein [Chitinispirillales bacterium]|jgi:anti-anti-sigma factor|nr:STAS domain-containing protein [Chitinispirillales bacterium]